MAKEEYTEEEQPVDTFESDPDKLRDDDEITDAEEAFMEGYEADAEEDEEEEEEEEEEFPAA